jgi:hypothetical protein
LPSQPPTTRPSKGPRLAGAALALLAVVALLLYLLRPSPAPQQTAAALAPETERAPPQQQPAAPSPSITAAAPVRPAAPAPQRPQPAPTQATGADGGPEARELFGGLVRLGQGFTLGESLARNAENADKYLDRFCDKSKKLHEKPPLQQHPGDQRDAAAFMAPLMDYEKPLDNPPGRLHLSPALKQSFDRYGTDWLTRISDEDLAPLDFTWMEQLLEFDHWSLLGAGRLKDTPMTVAMTFPLPNYVVLQYWVKLRLALSLRRGDFAASAAQIRHLADLTDSQGLLIAKMIAVALYKIEAGARARAMMAGYDVSGWPASDVQQLDLVRPLAFSAMYFTYPGVSPQTLRKAVACMSSPCTALAEGVGANRSFGAYAASDNLELVVQLAQERGCERELFDRSAKSAEVSAAEALESTGIDSGLDVGGQLPRFLDPLP